MSDELFRFSILRAADGPGALVPIVVTGNNANNPISDKLAGSVAEASSWMRLAVPKGATVEELTASSKVDLAPWATDEAAKAVNLEKSQLANAVRAAQKSPGSLSRGAIAAAGDRLTTAVLLESVATLPPSTVISEWIEKHPIQIVLPTASGWLPRQSLIRAPAISEHFVVRDELLGYQMAQLEDIKNYLKGEVLDHSLRYLSVNQTDTTNQTTTETDRTKESATEQRASLSAAAQTTADSSLGLDARVKTDGQYGPTKVSTDVGFQYKSSQSEAHQTASEFSSDVTQKTVETVKQQELVRISQLTRTEIEEVRDHKVDNTLGAGNTVGIYRWVDSVWKATTYSIGVRLILEFLIPEPGRAIRRSALAPQPKGLPPAPVAPPDNLFDTIDARSASSWASLYGADGIAAPPLTNQTIGFPFESTDFKDKRDPHIDGLIVKDIKVPDGYMGTSVDVVITSMGTMDADTSNLQVEIPGATTLTVEPTNTETAKDLTTVHFRASGTSFGPGATVPVSIFTEDIRGFSGFVSVGCALSQAARDSWRLDTVQKITAAYHARLSEWQALALAKSFDAAPPALPPDIEALCRHACISNLIGAWPSATGRHDAADWPTPGALANAEGELIEFVEQAFEWNNLQYVAYPYYWADPTDWNELLTYEDVDPHVREFLRAGAVRMVVPVRLDLTEAVLFYLDTAIPWFAGAAPVPGQPGYLPIADEIRDSRTTEGDGTYVSDYRYTLPTSLTILQDTGTLPPPPPL